MTMSLVEKDEQVLDRACLVKLGTSEQLKTSKPAPLNQLTKNLVVHVAQKFVKFSSAFCVVEDAVPIGVVTVKLDTSTSNTQPYIHQRYCKFAKFLNKTQMKFWSYLFLVSTRNLISRCIKGLFLRVHCSEAQTESWPRQFDESYRKLEVRERLRHRLPLRLSFEAHEITCSSDPTKAYFAYLTLKILRHLKG
jgi:hypothetical protein